MSKILILALGNPLRGDDGVGMAVLQQLAETAPPPDITLLDGGTPGLETILLMQGYEQVIVIDAAEMNLEPGQWRHFQPDQVRLGSGDPGLRGTLHSAGLAEALILGEALGVLPALIEVYGIQPAEIGWEPGLSVPVLAAVCEVAEAISHDLEIGKENLTPYPLSTSGERMPACASSPSPRVEKDLG